MQEEEKNTFNKFIDRIEEYLKTRQAYSKLVAVEKGSKAIAAVMTGLVVFSFFLLFFVFSSLALAYFISEYTGKPSIGFGTVGLIYLLIGLIVYAKRRSLEVPIMNSIIRNIFQETSHEED